MLETLITLQEKSLLSPMTNMATGLLAIIAVIINNAVLSRNLRRQLKAQSEENERKLLADAKLSATKEKRAKLEQILVYLHDYIEEMEKCFYLSRQLSAIDESNGKSLIPKAQELKERFNSGDRRLSKARILASSYSDLLDDKFSAIKQLSIPAQALFDLLCHYCFGQSDEYEYRVKIHTDKILSHLVEANFTESTIKETAHSLEDLLIEEIKSLIKHEENGTW